jgi:hypothetical protein
MHFMQAMRLYKLLYEPPTVFSTAGKTLYYCRLLSQAPQNGTSNLYPSLQGP